MFTVTKSSSIFNYHSSKTCFCGQYHFYVYYSFQRVMPGGSLQVIVPIKRKQSLNRNTKYQSLNLLILLKDHKKCMQQLYPQQSKHLLLHMRWRWRIIDRSQKPLNPNCIDSFFYPTFSQKIAILFSIIVGWSSLQLRLSSEKEGTMMKRLFKHYGIMKKGKS